MLSDVGYLVPSGCPSGYYGYDLKGNLVKSGKSYYCVSSDSVGNLSTLDKQFYRVMVFFRIDLPMLGDIFTFKIKGETESIPFAVDQSDKNTCGV